ncbi:MAG: TonB-dependent receptor plug domain-containing protein [Leptolyngbyaceae cyanobacterium RU_5_1]|nr:TonB-dependent receptor plug domain-containing protein [Leptolyngbyaceae cyanobacterium RU_5_1]
MKLHSIHSSWLAAILLTLIAQSVQAQITQQSTASRLKDLHRPATTVQEWLGQIQKIKQETRAESPISVTGVKLDRTDTGLEIVLETQDGKPLQVDATKFRTVGNSLIADIPNTVLALPNAQEFSTENPTAEIANVRVTQLDTNSIRINVAGKTAPPTQEVTLITGNLSYSLNPETDEPDEEIVVTGEGQRGYRVPNASTAAKLDVPLRDVPASVQVIPRQFIEDRQIVRLNDLADYVSGVQSQSGYGGLSSQGYYLRGFETSFEAFRNGFRDFGFLSPRDVANVERVEFLKGPASVLYGGSFGSIAGVVNTITKKPLADPRYAASMTFGSYSFYRPTLDFTRMGHYRHLCLH